jgi:hypothetical protein
MIIYHKNGEIDREQWDNCIRNSSWFKPYPYSWYLDIMCPGWEALVDDDYDSVFPLPVSGKFGIRFIQTPHFLQQLGAFSPDKPADKAVREFLHYLPDNYRFMDLNIRQKVDINGIKISEKVNFELDLTRSYDSLRENFSSVCLKNIETSEKKGIELVNGISPDELIDLFILNSGKEFPGIKSGTYHRLRSLMNFCIINRKGRIIGVRGGRKKLIFGMFVIEIKGSRTMLLMANTPQSRDKHIDYFAVNELVKSNASTKAILDFAAPGIAEDSSLTESFGAAKTSYYRICFNKLFLPVRFLR